MSTLSLFCTLTSSRLAQSRLQTGSGRPQAAKSPDAKQQNNPGSSGGWCCTTSEVLREPAALARGWGRVTQLNVSAAERQTLCRFVPSVASVTQATLHNWGSSRRPCMRGLWCIPVCARERGCCSIPACPSPSLPADAEGCGICWWGCGAGWGHHHQGDRGQGWPWARACTCEGSSWRRSHCPASPGPGGERAGTVWKVLPNEAVEAKAAN